MSLLDPIASLGGLLWLALHLSGEADFRQPYESIAPRKAGVNRGRDPALLGADGKQPPW